MQENERICLCAMNRLLGFEPSIANVLLEQFPDPSRLFNLSSKEKEAVFGPWSKYAGLFKKEELDKSKKELEELCSKGISFITVRDENYPKPLLECPDHPVGFYMKSSSFADEVFHAGPFISIVGTRDISQYGKEWCRRIVYALGSSSARPTIVSGLALGTDITAHLAALECGLPTIAVLPTGIDAVYPRTHYNYAKSIITAPQSGLITDYPPLTTPRAVNFLRRNRIIAGLGRATILIESKIKGGGLLTADLAFSYDREVFALPGRVDDICSQGCNLLISRNIAEPITDIETLVSRLGMVFRFPTATDKVEDRIRHCYSYLDSNEIDDVVRLYDTIVAHRGITPEELCSDSGRDYSFVSRLLSALESDGFIEMDLMQRCIVKVKNVNL